MFYFDCVFRNTKTLYGCIVVELSAGRKRLLFTVCSWKRAFNRAVLLLHTQFQSKISPKLITRGTWLLKDSTVCSHLNFFQTTYRHECEGNRKTQKVFCYQSHCMKIWPCYSGMWAPLVYTYCFVVVPSSRLLFALKTEKQHSSNRVHQDAIMVYRGIISLRYAAERNSVTTEQRIKNIAVSEIGQFTSMAKDE